jgi:hypothetical protein
LREKPLKVEFDGSISKLAIDFFYKLCTYPASERYDSKSALKHPWITGIVDAEIPLT